MLKCIHGTGWGADDRKKVMFSQFYILFMLPLLAPFLYD